MMAAPVLAEPSGETIQCPGVQWATNTYHMNVDGGWGLLVHPKDAWAETRSDGKTRLACNYDNGARATMEVAKRCRSIVQRGMWTVQEINAHGTLKTACVPRKDKSLTSDFDCAFTCE
jgi:hypothetical protein